MAQVSRLGPKVGSHSAVPNTSPEPGELSVGLSHDDSTINFVLSIFGALCHLFCAQKKFSGGSRSQNAGTRSLPINFN